MALSYEENQGPLHSLLAQVLWDISIDVNASSVMLSSEVTHTARNFTVLKVKKIIEKIMNSSPNITVLWIAKVLTKVKNETPEKNLVPLIICSLEPPLLFLRHFIPFLYMTYMPNIQVYTVNKPPCAPTTRERLPPISDHLYKYQIFPVKVRTTRNRPHLVGYRDPRAQGRDHFLGWQFYNCPLFLTCCTRPLDSWFDLYVRCVQCATQTLWRAYSELYTWAINSLPKSICIEISSWKERPVARFS